MQPRHANLAERGLISNEPSFLVRASQTVRVYVDTQVQWLGRTVRRLYRDASPTTIRVAKLLFENIFAVTLLQLFSLEVRVTCYVVAALTASCIRVGYASARVFRPFVLSAAVDFIKAALSNLPEEPFPYNVITSGYLLFYAAIASMIAMNLEEVIRNLQSDG